eukprot:sb/3465310/
MSTELIEVSDSGGNLTPPVSVYNTSLASEIVTISGLPFGIGAVIANILLIVCNPAVYNVLCVLRASSYLRDTSSRLSDDRSGTYEGVPLNLAAMIFFIKSDASSKRKFFFKSLYTVISVSDLLICLTSVPVIEALFSNRNPKVFFGNDAFCKIWGILWEILPYWSVFLIGCLSISRTIILLLPTFQLQHRYLVLSLSLYLTLLLARAIIPAILSYGDLVYQRYCVYCFLKVNSNSEFFRKLKGQSSVAMLAAPVLPIALSSILSICKLQQRQGSYKVGSGKAQSHATKTIILITQVYVLCNLPTFANYIYYYTWSFSAQSKAAQGAQSYTVLYMENPFWWYSWTVTYVVLTALNSTLNPAVYLMRMKPFRRFIMSTKIATRASEHKSLARSYVRSALSLDGP